MAATAEAIHPITANLGARSNATLPYRVHDATTYLAAYSAVMSQMAVDYSGGLPGDLVVQNIDLVGIESPGEWNAKVRVVSPGGKQTEPPATGSTPSRRFQVGHDRRRILISPKTRNAYGKFGGDAPYMYGLINVSEKGVEGCDLGDTSGALLFSLTHYVPYSSINNSYVKALADLVWHINDDTFIGFDAGCVLFLGANGGQRGLGDWEITFDFAAKQDVADACADWDSQSGFGTPGSGAGAVAIPVKAWDYMWAYCKKVPVTIADKELMIYRPQYLYVEQIYPEADLSDLGGVL